MFCFHQPVVHSLLSYVIRGKREVTISVKMDTTVFDGDDDTKQEVADQDVFDQLPENVRAAVSDTSMIRVRQLLTTHRSISYFLWLAV